MDPYEELDFTVGVPIPPKRIKLHCGMTDILGHTYVPLKECKLEITMSDEEAIGSSKCSFCGSSIDISAKYCPKCGAKVRGKIIKE